MSLPRRPEVFKLKYRDTRPGLEVILKRKTSTDEEVPYDLTGASSVKLHISLADGLSTLTRTMTVDADPTTGIVRYPWVAGDWNEGSLVAGEHEMEYEVIGPSPVRITFPNAGHDTLRVTQDLGQG